MKGAQNSFNSWDKTFNIMKKILLVAMSLAMAIGTSAQSKKELQSKVEELEKLNTELNTHMTKLDAQVGEITTMVKGLQTDVSKLQSENEQLKEKINAQQTNAATKEEEEATHFVSDSIADMLLKFYGATTVEERAKYVMDPERVLPLMRNYYKGGITPLKEFYWVSGDATEDSPKEEGAVAKGSGLYYLEADLVEDYTVRHIVLRTSQGFKLDWEATVQYGETSDFMLTKANVGKTFTFHCQIGNHVYKRNDYYDEIILRNMWGTKDINRYSPGDPDLGEGVFQKDGSIARRLREIIDNREPDYSDGTFYIIVKAEVKENNKYRSKYNFELKDTVSETPSYFVRKRPKKQKLTF